MKKINVLIITILFLNINCIASPDDNTAKVEINAPLNNEVIVNPDRSFHVSGTSQNIQKHHLKIYLLIHPLKYTGLGYWLHPQYGFMPDEDGNWQSDSYIGSSTSPPENGEIFEIIVIATDQTEKIAELYSESEETKIRDLYSLPTNAMSKILKLTVKLK